MKVDWGVLGVVLCVQLALGGCSEKSPERPAPVVKQEAAGSISLRGVGASFPAPLYRHWFRSYSDVHPEVSISYEAEGSGAGISAVRNGLVDFGASDAVLTEDERTAVPQGAQVIPLAAGAVVLAFNLNDLQTVQLTRRAYEGIFLGTITRWQDPEITSVNPGVHIPDLPIKVVVRADSSGTSYLFSQHLAAISARAEEQIGRTMLPKWPVGTKVRGSSGMAAAIKQTPGAVGYVQGSFALTHNLAVATLENRARNFVAPSSEAGTAALLEADLAAEMVGWVEDPRGAQAYPIVGYTWLILYQSYDNPRKLGVLKDVIRFGVTDGQAVAERLGYVRLPEDVVLRIQGRLKQL